MKQTKYYVFSVLAVFAFVSVALVFTHPAVFAASATSEVCEAIGSGAGCADPSGGSEGASLFNVVQTVTNILSVLIGVLAVIFIIVGGLKYVTSNGDSNKVGSAKSTILYAIIGLIIAGLAQLIVNVVISQSASF